MTDHELLSALSDMMDTKLKPIKDDIKILQDDMKIVKGEIKSMKGDIINMKADIKGLQKDMITVKADIKGLKDKMEHVENKLNIISIMHENKIIPRLNDIEQCYLSTYKRYVDTTEKMEKKMDIHYKNLHTQ